MPKTRKSPWYHYKVAVVLDHLTADMVAEEKLQRMHLYAAAGPSYSQNAIEEMLHNIAMSYRLKQMDFDVQSYVAKRDRALRSHVGTFQLLKKVGAL